MSAKKTTDRCHNNKRESSKNGLTASVSRPSKKQSNQEQYSLRNKGSTNPNSGRLIAHKKMRHYQSLQTQNFNQETINKMQLSKGAYCRTSPDTTHREAKSLSLKKFNRQVRSYNKRHFKSVALQQPPWGIDQQRLKQYAIKLLTMQGRLRISAQPTKRGHATSYSTVSPLKNRLNPEYFHQSPKSKSKGRQKKKKVGPRTTSKSVKDLNKL